MSHSPFLSLYVTLSLSILLSMSLSLSASLSDDQHNLGLIEFFIKRTSSVFIILQNDCNYYRKILISKGELQFKSVFVLNGSLAHETWFKPLTINNCLYLRWFPSIPLCIARSLFVSLSLLLSMPLSFCFTLYVLSFCNTKPDTHHPQVQVY